MDAYLVSVLASTEGVYDKSSIEECHVSQVVCIFTPDRNGAIAL